MVAKYGNCAKHTFKPFSSRNRSSTADLRSNILRNIYASPVTFFDMLDLKRAVRNIKGGRSQARAVKRKTDQRKKIPEPESSRSEKRDSNCC